MSRLPDYVASAQPNPVNNRIGWLTTTAATYAGIMLWFVFWQDVPGGGATFAGGVLSQGLPLAIIGIVVAAFLCHFLCYLAPALMGMKSGFGLSVVGTSTYGVQGGFLMPGFLMGALQFGWLGVNGYFSSLLLTSIPLGKEAIGGPIHLGVGVVWIILATFVGMKGLKYVGMIASYTPIIPFAVLMLLLFKTIGGVGAFDPSTFTKAAIDKAQIAAVANELSAKSGAVAPAELAAKLAPIAAAVAQDATETPEIVEEVVVVEAEIAAPASVVTEGISEVKPVTLFGNGTLGVLSLICAYAIGFFATAGAAGVGFGSNHKDASAIQNAGFVGIIGATSFAGIIALIAVAGFSGLNKDNPAIWAGIYNVPALFEAILGKGTANLCMFGLALAAFPSACFPTVVAADAFKTTFPKVNPLISCGIGVFAAILLVITQYAGEAAAVFGVIGASFGPICGAMTADYILSGCKWAGPRAGYNPAGWISWIVGFAVGSATLIVTKFGGAMPFEIPCPPLSAIIVGFVLYWVLAKAGLESKKLDLPQRIDV